MYIKVAIYKMELHFPSLKPKTLVPKIVYSSKPFSVEAEEWLVGRPSRGRLGTSSAFHGAAGPYKGMWLGPGCITTAARTG